MYALVILACFQSSRGLEVASKSSVVRVFSAQLGFTYARQIQVRPCLSAKDIDEQCEFPQFSLYNKRKLNSVITL